eukprot:12830-Prorocentrum_minimum.AAC.1
MCPEREPIAGGRRAYTRSGNQSRAGGGHVPGVGTNRGREEGMCPEWEPIAGGRSACTQSANQTWTVGGSIPEGGPPVGMSAP